MMKMKDCDIFMLEFRLYNIFILWFLDVLSEVAFVYKQSIYFTKVGSAVTCVFKQSNCFVKIGSAVKKLDAVFHGCVYLAVWTWWV